MNLFLRDNLPVDRDNILKQIIVLQILSVWYNFLTVPITFGNYSSE